MLHRSQTQKTPGQKVASPLFLQFVANKMRRCGKSFFNWKILKFLGDIGIILNVFKNWFYSIIKNRVNHLGIQKFSFGKFQNSRNQEVMQYASKLYQNVSVLRLFNLFQNWLESFLKVCCSMNSLVPQTTSNTLQ